VTTSFDPFLSSIMGEAAHAPLWPPRSFAPRPGMHAAEEWVGELLRYGQQLRTEILHFPDVLAVQQIEHRGVRHPVVLLGLRLMTRASQMSTGRVPRISDGGVWGGVWGGVVEIDGRDLLDRRDLWCDIEYAGKAAIVVHDKMAEGIVATFAVALMAAEGMHLRRYTIDPDGNAQGSAELWVVEGGQVRRVGLATRRRAAAPSPELNGGSEDPLFSSRRSLRRMSR